MRELSPAYIAGFFDGEGCVGVYNRNGAKNGPQRYFVLCVSIAQAGDDGRVLLLELKTKYGGSVSSKKTSGGTKVMWQWYTSADKAAAFLRDIQPHLRLKSEQVAVALEFQALVGKGAEGAGGAYCDQLKSLKRAA